MQMENICLEWEKSYIFAFPLEGRVESIEGRDFEKIFQINLAGLKKFVSLQPQMKNWAEGLGDLEKDFLKKVWWIKKLFIHLHPLLKTPTEGGLRD